MEFFELKAQSWNNKMVTEHLRYQLIAADTHETRLKIGADEFESHTLMQPITRRIGETLRSQNRETLSREASSGGCKALRPNRSPPPRS